MNDRVGVVHRREAQRPPEALELVDGDAGELGDLHPRVAAPRRHEHAIRHEEVDDAVRDGLVDLFLGGPAHEQDLLDVHERSRTPRLVHLLRRVLEALEQPVTSAAPATASRPIPGARAVP